MTVQLRPVPSAPALRREAMRIAGRKVSTDETIEVFNPYTEACIGSVPSPANRAGRARTISAISSLIALADARATSAGSW